MLEGLDSITAFEHDHLGSLSSAALATEGDNVDVDRSFSSAPTEDEGAGDRDYAKLQAGEGEGCAELLVDPPAQMCCQRYCSLPCGFSASCDPQHLWTLKYGTSRYKRLASPKRTTVCYCGYLDQVRLQVKKKEGLAWGIKHSSPCVCYNLSHNLQSRYTYPFSGRQASSLIPSRNFTA